MTPRIVTFCNADYIAVAQNWLRALENVGLGHAALIVSLDDATRDAFAANQVLHRPLSISPKNLGALWSHRISVLRELLEGGEAIIHSDADAVWIGNPIRDIEACKAEIVFSQGTVWPPDIHQEHGLVLCCGFFFLKSCPPVIAFLDAVDARMPEDKDDQVAVNRVIASWIDGWVIEQPYHIPFRQTQYVASRTPIYAQVARFNGQEMRIAVLPHHAYPRLLDEVASDMVVVHPLSGKSLDEKVTCLSQLDLLLGTS